MIKTIKILQQINQVLLKNAVGSAVSLALILILPMAIAKDTDILTDIEKSIIQTSLTANSVSVSYSKKMTLVITGYSSTIDQTDNTPLITASNKTVTDGIVAANFLPFGTKIQIPKIFGDKVFVVEDRMHERFSDRIDIWFADRDSAVKFGKKTAEVIIL